MENEKAPPRRHILYKRLPTWREAAVLWTTCAFVVYLWALLGLLRSMPSLLMRLPVREMVVVASYVLAFALIESALIFLVLLLLGALLPRSVFRQDWVARGGLFMIVTGVWTGIYHLMPGLLKALQNMGNISYQALSQGFVIAFVIYLAAYPAVLWIGLRQLGRRTSAAETLTRFLERLATPSWVYVAMGAAGALVVILRLTGIYLK